jgi:hypothetical protein
MEKGSQPSHSLTTYDLPILNGGNILLQSSHGSFVATRRIVGVSCRMLGDPARKVRQTSFCRLFSAFGR